jgi:hypothetical protein
VHVVAGAAQQRVVFDAAVGLDADPGGRHGQGVDGVGAAEPADRELVPWLRGGHRDPGREAGDGRAGDRDAVGARRALHRHLVGGVVRDAHVGVDRRDIGAGKVLGRCAAYSLRRSTRRR